MKYISCNVNLFTLGNMIYVRDTETDEIREIAISDFDHLPQTIIAACAQEGTDEVKLYGSKLYVNEIAESIVELAKTNYSNYNIMVEVI